MSSLQLSQLGGLGFSSGVESFTEAALRALFSDLYFESNVTPKIHVHDPFGPIVDSAVGQIVQPKITLVSPQLGAKVVAPWGRPSPSTFPTLAVLGAIGAGVVGYYAWKGWRS